MLVHIGVPAYGGVVHGSFASSLHGLLQRLRDHGHSAKVDWMFNESLIPRARNNIASNALLEGKADALQFIDADLDFSPDELLRQIEDVGSGAGPSIAGGNYPAKAYDVEAISLAANDGVRGPDLMKHGLIMVTNYKRHTDLPPGTPGKDTVCAWYYNNSVYLEAAGLPTGLLTVSMGALRKLAKRCKMYKDGRYSGSKEQVPRWDLFPSRPFKCGDETLYLSEDYGFCRLATDNGMRLWSNINNIASHWGTHQFKAHQ